VGLLPKFVAGAYRKWLETSGYVIQPKMIAWARKKQLVDVTIWSQVKNTYRTHSIILVNLLVDGFLKTADGTSQNANGETTLRKECD